MLMTRKTGPEDTRLLKKNWKAKLHFVQSDVELVSVWDASVHASNASDRAIALSILDRQDIVHRW